MSLAKSLIKGIGAFVVVVMVVSILVVAVVPFLCMSGFILSKLWLWFVVPLFSVSALSLPQAIGVTCVVHYLTYRPDIKKLVEEPTQKAEAMKFVKQLAGTLGYHGACLLEGYIIHTYFLS